MTLDLVDSTPVARLSSENDKPIHTHCDSISFYLVGEIANFYIPIDKLEQTYYYRILCSFTTEYLCA